MDDAMRDLIFNYINYSLFFSLKIITINDDNYKFSDKYESEGKLFSWWS